MTRFVFITGGVVSSLGKGISAASLGALLEARGLAVDIFYECDKGNILLLFKQLYINTCCG